MDKHEAANAAGPICADDSLQSRRAFLTTSVAAAAAAWIAADWPGIVAAAEYAEQSQQTARSGRPAALAVFSDAQAAELDAVVSRIIPTDETPGAHEAGIVYFIDRAVATFSSSSHTIYTQGFDELQAKTGQMFPGFNKFSALNAAQQIWVLTAMETTPFFKTVRDHTVIGMFASPQHGGNYRQAGWKLIGFQDTLNFTPPFGYYDAAP